jgi:hypothetical protein
MRSVNRIEDLARKGERVTIQFDDPEVLRQIEQMAEDEERPVSRQALLLIRMALELINDQGFHVVNGKLRRGTFEELDTDEN